MSPIALLDRGWDVAEAVKQLDAHPELWNRHTMRTDAYATPHKAVDDIWVRYRRWEDFTGDVAAFNGPHDAEWYPAVHAIPAVWSLVRRVMRRYGGKTLGGVLITRIPPGGEVKPHVDTGWHAGHYEKIAVQLRGDERQAFHFADVELRTVDGDVYTFDNARTHWVTNDSARERITLIVCLTR